MKTRAPLFTFTFTFTPDLPRVPRLFLLLLALLATARADFTIVQRVEGGLNAGQMTLRIKDDKARADLAAQVSTITDLASGEWTPLLEIEGGGEALEILDTEAPSLPRYFYRIILLP